MTEIAFTQMKDIKEIMLSDISNERLSEIILSEGDAQKHNTSLKCDMTEWRLHKKYEDVKKLSDTIQDRVGDMVGDKGRLRFILSECWGAVYHKGQISVPHNHFPFTISFVYFVQIPEGSSPLIFDESHKWNMEKEITEKHIIVPKTGKLVIFPSECKHSVPPSSIDEERIVIAGNLFFLPNKVELK